MPLQTNLTDGAALDASVINAIAVQVNTNTTALAGGSALSSVVATGSSASRTLANRFADIVNVLDFGALGVGGNDTAAIQAAITEAAAVGKSVYIPGGNYGLASTTSGISALIAPSNTRLHGDGPTQTIFTFLLAASTPVPMIGNTNRANLTLFNTPPTTSGNQTDTGITIEDIGFNLAGVASSSAISFYLATNLTIRRVYVVASNSIAASSFQFIGCDEWVVSDTRGSLVWQHVDTWKGSTRGIIDNFIASSATGATNGGLINVQGVGQTATDYGTSSGITVSNGSMTLNNSCGMFLDADGGGSVTQDVRLSNLEFIAATGTCEGIIARGAGGGVAGKNLSFRCLSGATLNQPILIGVFYGYAGPHTGTGIVSTVFGQAYVTATFPGNDVGPGSYLEISNGSGGAITGNGVSLNGWYLVTAVSGSTITCATGQTATAGSALSASTTLQGCWGCFRNTQIDGVLIDGCGGSGVDLIALQGSGHQVSGVTVTQNYLANTTPQFRSIIAIDGGGDIGNANQVPSQFSNVIGAPGTGSLTSGWSGDHYIQWSPGGPTPSGTGTSGAVANVTLLAALATLAPTLPTAPTMGTTTIWLNGGIFTWS